MPNISVGYAVQQAEQEGDVMVGNANAPSS